MSLLELVGIGGGSPLLWISIAGGASVFMAIRIFRHATRHWVSAAVLGFIPTLNATQAAQPQLKKVAVLELVNLDKNSNVEYLSGSMTEAMEEKLSGKFSYQKAEKREINRVAEENFLFKDDFATKSVALNLGLLAKQDVVIAGGFSVRKGGKGEELFTTVRIYDIPNKKVVAEIKEKSPVDSSIFESVDKITTRIVDAAKAVLPTKDEWQRGGGKTASGPWFNNWSLSLAAGGGIYAMEYADRLRPELPALRMALTGNMPLVAEKATIQLAASYLTDKPIAGKNPALEGLDAVTTTVMPGLWLGYRWEPGSWQIGPRLGGGYALQSIKVSGLRNENLTNMLPFAGAGFDVGLRLSRNLDLALSLEGVAQAQAGKLTVLSMAYLGVNFRL